MGRKAGPGTWLLVGGLFLFMAAFLFYPLGYVVDRALRPEGHLTWTFVWAVLSNPASRRAALNSLLLASVTTMATFVFTLPLSYLAARREFAGKQLLGGLTLLPLVLPPFVGAIGMKQLLARFGSVNMLLLDSGLVHSPVDFLGGAKFWGVVVLQVLHLYPIMYLNVTASLASVDRGMEEAARNLGASPFRTFRRVTLPMAAPGVFAGAVIVFIWALTDLGTPLVFEYRDLLSVQIFERVTDMQDNPEGYALVLWVLLLTAGGFLVARRLFGSARNVGAAKGGRVTDNPRVRGPALLWVYALFGAVVFLSVLPHLSVLLTSLQDDWFMTVLPHKMTFSHYEAALAHPLTIGSIRNSLVLSSGATMVDALIGVAVAYVLARVRFRGAALLDAMTMLPLALPGIVVAFGYMGAYAGTAVDPRKDPTVLLIVAYAVRRLPYMVRAAYAGFSQVDVSLEEAAVNLGAPASRVLWRVTLPLVALSLLAGAILAFSFAMMEVSDSLILALREQDYPITKAIYMLLGRLRDGPEMACALGVWAMAFLSAALLAAHRILGKRMGELFRS